MKKHPKYNLHAFDTINELNTATAELIITIANKSIESRDRFVLALSGGQTPKALFTFLAQPAYRDRIPWNKTFVFWGDERCVPLDNEQNNAYQAKILLLDQVDIPSSNIYAIPVNLTPDEAAQTYERTILDFFGTQPIRFDLILLGLGENGHTASFFPFTKIIHEQTEGIRAVNISSSHNIPLFRITMTAPMINHAHDILFLVTGKTKANILYKVLSVPLKSDLYPAQLIHPTDGKLSWYADKDAASLIVGW